MSHLVLLDNEAVQALASPTHPKHRRVLAHVQVVAHRRGQAVPMHIAVPTSVRVEAGWDRTDRTSALLNRLRIVDAALDTRAADTAATIRRRTAVSVADAHLGAVMAASEADRITVVTSDPADMDVVAGDRHVVVVTI